MSSVEDVLNRKGREVHSIRPNEKVRTAIGMMAQQDVGALIVRTGPLPLGVFSERDYVRKSVTRGAAILDQSVRDVMTLDTPWVHPRDTLYTCMNLMTLRAVRHLPVIDGLRLSGIVSLGDVVSALVAGQEFELDQLHEYMLRLR